MDRLCSLIQSSQSNSEFGVLQLRPWPCLSFTVCCLIRSQNSMLSTVCGAKRRKTGPMPLYKPNRPSAWHTFSIQSENPWYRRPWKPDKEKQLKRCILTSSWSKSFVPLLSARTNKMERPQLNSLYEIHPLAGCRDVYWWHQTVSWWTPQPLHWSWLLSRLWASCLD